MNDRDPELEARLRRALHRQGDAHPVGPDRWSDVEARAGAAGLWQRRRSGLLTTLTVAASLALGLVAVAALRDDGGQTIEAGPAATATTTESTAIATPAPYEFPHTPIWPFRTQAEAEEWRTVGQAAGHQPWHAEPDETALAFTRDFLGFTEIDRVIVEVEFGGGHEAKVDVGYPTEGGRTGTAATVLLARFGAEDDAPWEVYGAIGREFEMTRPTGGETLEAGGEIPVRIHLDGVDEALHIQVLDQSGKLEGEACCPPAGGMDTDWDVPVTYNPAAAGPVLAIVASTGGHLQGIERFAVVGVRIVPVAPAASGG